MQVGGTELVDGEIAAVMELDTELIAKVMSDGRRGNRDRVKKGAGSFHDQVQQLVYQGCSVGDIKVAFPRKSEREIEEAVARAVR